MNKPFAWITKAALTGWLESDKDPRPVTFLSSEGNQGMYMRVGLYLEEPLPPVAVAEDDVVVDIDFVERNDGGFNIRMWQSHGKLKTGKYRLYNQTPATSDADQVLAMLDTGEWSLLRMTTAASFTDEYNRENAWSVGRTTAPFCDKNGMRFWSGPTALSALRKAESAIAEMLK